LQRNIITLKWGKRYGADYVNRLARSVRRNISGEVNIVCFTDDGEGIEPGIQIFPIPEIDLPEKASVTGWRKLCLFRTDLPIRGDCLFLDLDLVITGSLDPFFTYEPDRIPIIHNWLAVHKTWFRKRPEVGNSSVFRFKANECGFVWDQFHGEKEWALANFQPPQTYLTHCIRPKMCYWPEHWVRSFKRHCQQVFPFNLLLTPSLPADASIIVFHGKPDPEEVIDGYRGRKMHHHCKPTPWVSKYWY
jgi:hypothetical protein